jgi:hypothetical protein
VTTGKEKSLTGIWHGLYHYPAIQKPTYFVATLISFGKHFSGTTHEATDGQDNAPLQLFASVEGSVHGSVVSFVKRYDRETGLDYSIDYEGKLSADGSEIEGTWHIPSDWSGTFLMVRGQGASEKAVRTAFERV